MTWKTPEGDRILDREEARLIIEALNSIFNCDDDGDDDNHGDYWLTTPTGGAFDFLSNEKKWTVLEDVVGFLLDESKFVPELNEIHCAAIYFLFEVVKDSPDNLARVIVNAYDKRFPKEADDESEEDCGRPTLLDASDYPQTSGDFDSAVDELRDQVLHDADFQMYEEFHPQTTQTLETCENMLIDPDYFFPDDAYKFIVARPGSRERLKNLVDMYDSLLNIHKYFEKDNKIRVEAIAKWKETAAAAVAATKSAKEKKPRNTSKAKTATTTTAKGGKSKASSSKVKKATASITVTKVIATKEKVTKGAKKPTKTTTSRKGK